MKSYDYTFDKSNHPNVYVNHTSTRRFDRMPTIKKIIVFSFLSVLFPLSTLLADVCPANTEDLANNYKNQGYTIFHCESNSFSSQIESVNDNINLVVCGTGTGDITTYEFADPYNRDQSTKTMAIDDESQGGDITVSNVWAGFTSIDITCSGDFYIAYKPEDLMAAVNPDDYSTDPNDQNTNPDTEEPSNPNMGNTVDSVDYKGTTFQGGWDGKDVSLFSNKTINNVTFTDITIEIVNENGGEPGLLFTNSTITNTIFKDNDELPPLNFQGSTLDEVEFQNYTLKRPIFYTTNIKKVEFINSVLLAPDFTETDLSNTTFDDTIICAAQLTDATFDQDTFKGATVFKAYYVDNGAWAAANIDGNIIDDGQAPKECQNYQ